MICGTGLASVGGRCTDDAMTGSTAYLILMLILVLIFLLFLI